MNEELAQLQKIDQELTALRGSMNVLDYLTPLNKNEEGRKFFADDKKEYNPEFTYKEIDYDPDEFENNMINIEIPKTELGDLLEKRRQNIILESRMIQSRGYKEKMIQLCKRMYKLPSEALVKYAIEILENTQAVKSDLITPARIVKKAVEQTFEKYEMNDWRVIEDSNRITTQVSVENKAVYINPQRLFTKKDPLRLGVHEIGVHALRAKNGAEQPLSIFERGLPGYLPTEEGLATYAEEITQLAEPKTMRLYAGRVVAIHALLEGKTFREIFNLMRAYDFNKNEAWNLALRVTRGGGYVKDHVYLKGYKKIKTYLKNKGDLKILYVGKIGISDIPLVKRLLRQKILAPPKYLPDFLQ